MEDIKNMIKIVENCQFDRAHMSKIEFFNKNKCVFSFFYVESEINKKY